MESTIQKNCNACNKIIRGRSDKKFCNDYCRNAYNNQIKSPTNNLIRNTNNRLSKNRRILENIIEDKKQFIKVKKEQLMQLGFSFEYTTQIHQNKKGKIYFFCYDYGYFMINNEWCVIIKNEKLINNTVID
jgi:hypothetical protein